MNKEMINGWVFDISKFREEICLISVIKPVGREHFVNPGVNMRIILK
jgi:hypothetical protein